MSHQPLLNEANLFLSLFVMEELHPVHRLSFQIVNNVTIIIFSKIMDNSHMKLIALCKRY